MSMPPSAEAMNATRRLPRSTSSESTARARCRSRPRRDGYLLAPGRSGGDQRLAEHARRRWRAPRRPTCRAARRPSPAGSFLNLPLPRPPAWICALTTKSGPRACARRRRLVAACRRLPFGTGTPNCAAAPWPDTRGCSCSSCPDCAFSEPRAQLGAELTGAILCSARRAP